MGFTFSTDQQSVIDARESNILVSAAAGSGKTAVLTERIAGRITDENDPVDIDRILVVTFTNAAAKEMKERISKKINDELLRNPENAHLQKQTTLIHGALITTIDSFCLYLLKNHFHAIDVDPSFRVADEGEMSLLKADILDEVMKHAYESGDKDFYNIVDCYSKKSKDDSLEKSIMSLFNYAMSYPWPKQWLENRRSDYSYESKEAFENSVFLEKVKKGISSELDGALRTAETSLKKCELPGGPYCYSANIEGDIELILKLKDAVIGMTWNEVKAAFEGASFSTLSRKGADDCDAAIKESVKDARDEYKKIVASIKSEFFGRSLDEQYSDMTACAPLVNKMIDLVEDFMDSFEAAKRERDVIDFSDMEHMAVQILIKSYNEDGSYEPTDVARSYQNFFKEVMVDEYQDSNLVQELIIRSVSREDAQGTAKNRFMVGDVKQSIYRFRLARPEIFMDKLGAFEKNEKARNRLITLKSNYRSRKSVIDSVNAVFERTMVKEYGRVDYDDDARLYFGAEYSGDVPANKTEVVFVKPVGNSEKNREEEALAIAYRIHKVLDELEVFDKDKKEMRKARFSDVAVLFRSPVKWLDPLKKAFLKYSIPFHAEGVGTFYDTREISDVLSFLKIINNPLDDISLYAAMISPFGKMSDEEMARIKVSGTPMARFLWNRVTGYAVTCKDEKTVRFVSLVERFRKLSYVIPIDELISRLFDETGYMHIASALPGGEQRVANLNMLVSKARSFSKSSFYGLFHFIRYVELIKKLETSEGEANIFDENSNTVRVMSIHKSKGLEFPICIVGGMDERFNERDLREAFVTDIDEGIGTSFIDPLKRTKRHTLKKDFIIHKSRNEAIGEEIRILYVAMTRAREKLILFQLSEDYEKWLSKVPPVKKSTYADMILGAVSERTDLFDRMVIDGTECENALIAKEIDVAKLHADFETAAQMADMDMVARLRERLAFKYTYEGLSNLYTKTTVSELKMAAMEDTDKEALHPFEEEQKEAYVPVFVGGSLEVKGTDRGTAYHNLLQLLSFEKLPDTSEDSALMKFILAETDSMKEKGEMPKEDIEKVFLSKIRDFLKTDVAKRMSLAAKTDSLFKEQPFVIGVSANEIDDAFPASETILVQGVIDVYFVENGEITVLDYKTDRVDHAQTLVSRYKKQLDYYGTAVSKLTGMKVREKLIYSFGLNEVIVVK